MLYTTVYVCVCVCVCVLMLGDFNTRVGYCKSDDDVWSAVLGHHGLDVRNQAGEEFLSFCEINQLLIMNTWFQKKRHHYGSCVRPVTRCGSVIDLWLCIEVIVGFVWTSK